MPVILGIDTGGTYTDSVLVDPIVGKVTRKAKAFTTRHSLLSGIETSLDRLQLSDPEAIHLVCLSTTLATNAVVEQQGGRVGALLLGQDADRTLPATYTHRLRGLLDIKGRILEDISCTEVAEVVSSWAGAVDAVAISGFASVRNPVHENKVRDIVQQTIHVPVVCAHELSSALGVHERTVTAVLNAALIPCICEWIEAATQALSKRGIHAPLMIVKGDGSLMHADFARERPIETILSGPAASIVGGLFLSGVSDALLLDMGGTTTDIAQVEHGQVRMRTSGATVGSWHTQLQAAQIATFGIGGDSRIQMQPDGSFIIGPQRVLPLCVAGLEQPDLAEEFRTYVPSTGYLLFQEQRSDCYRLIRKPHHRPLTAQEEQLFALLQDGPHSLFYLAHHMQKDAEKLSLSELLQEGAIQRCGLTPTDLLHLRGEMTCWHTETAREGARLLAADLGLSLEDWVKQAYAAVQSQLRICCIQAAADFAGVSILSHDPMARFFLSGSDLIKTQFYFQRPIVALGAPAHAWLPAVCESLGIPAEIPEHAEVANAVGAAVGQVLITAEALIRPDQYHKGYLVHASWGNPWFATLEEAEHWAKDTAKIHAEKQAKQAGSGVCTVRCTAHPTYSTPLGQDSPQFIQSKIVATAIGSPQWKE